MRVILLERVEKLGFIGDQVEVKSGFARNFLLPKGKALRSTSANIEYFASKKAEMEANNLKNKAEAEKIRDSIGNVSLTVVRQASESGMLFGSVRPIDISRLLQENGFDISKSQVNIAIPIKTIGNHNVKIILHSEVSLDINVKVMTVQEQTEISEDIEPVKNPTVDS
ncbi:MAG: 50S ribosomal protein L9 [Holosporales bacterium]|jgi:large subunit ribosomal protein L9|nr:50S ribosomal protein L9 [Holosporales bacterium]